jgi:hypothetical protein
MYSIEIIHLHVVLKFLKPKNLMKITVWAPVQNIFPSSVSTENFYQPSYVICQNVFYSVIACLSVSSMRTSKYESMKGSMHQIVLCVVQIWSLCSHHTVRTEGIGDTEKFYIVRTVALSWSFRVLLIGIYEN